MSQLHKTPVSRQAASARHQMSRDRVFDGRARTAAAARRAHASYFLDRDAFMRRWSLLMIASFGSREECAMHFGVAFQTACNWFDAINRPYGDAVAHAVETLPRYFEIMGARS